ncbi:MAG TPA: sulfatase [Planctomycetaceae bacterium]|nr:sulfatase [Planctomycetaceae bacterium]HRF00770.1 DUF1501 domain-containing protein [Pirellulaceae bacterium]
MDPRIEAARRMTRRQFFGEQGLRMGNVALAAMAGSAIASSSGAARGATVDATELSGGSVHPGLPGLPHFPGTAKSVIYLHMNGGPSQIDLWDYKPGLQDYFDKELPPSIQGGQRLSTMTSGQQRFPVAPSKFKFEQAGECGTWVNVDLLPHTSKIVDDIALIRTVHTNAINHDPACTFVMTGSEIPGKASLGSWVSYGLGSDNDDLPSFVVFTPRFPGDSNGQALYNRMWGSGFLPTRYNGVALRGSGDPVLYLADPDGVERSDRRHMLDALDALNRRNLDRYGDPETATRIAQYEMAFRMQTSIPDLIDISNETDATLEMYGPDVRTPGTFAHSALIARRLVERGVRVVQLAHRGWDQHGALPYQLGNQCRDTDQGTAALVMDLKQRGLLENTLVVWGGEFGRTVYSQGNLTRDDYGRDHHPRNYCMWMAGGGVKGGIVHGETDEFSYNVVRDGVSLFDLNATILHCLGIDHTRLTFPFQGLDQRLTGVEPAGPVMALLK